jgi:hypothetical protein
MFTPVVCCDSLHLLLFIVTANGYVPQRLTIKSSFLYGELKQTIYICLPEGYRDGYKVTHLTRPIYGLNQLPRAWYTRITAHLRCQGSDISNFIPCLLWHKSDQLYIAVYIDDLTLYGPSGHLIDTPVLALETKFEVTNTGQLY